MSSVVRHISVDFGISFWYVRLRPSSKFIIVVDFITHWCGRRVECNSFLVLLKNFVLIFLSFENISLFNFTIECWNTWNNNLAFPFYRKYEMKLICKLQ